MSRRTFVRRNLPSALGALATQGILAVPPVPLSAKVERASEDGTVHVLATPSWDHPLTIDMIVVVEAREAIITYVFSDDAR